jgi:hypothetical protein
MVTVGYFSFKLCATDHVFDDTNVCTKVLPVSRFVYDNKPEDVLYNNICDVVPVVNPNMLTLPVILTDPVNS